MTPVPAEAARSIRNAAAESKLNIKGVFRMFAESPFFVFPEFNIVSQERKGYI